MDGKRHRDSRHTVAQRVPDALQHSADFLRQTAALELVVRDGFLGKLLRTLLGIADVVEVGVENVALLVGDNVGNRFTSSGLFGGSRLRSPSWCSRVCQQRCHFGKPAAQGSRIHPAEIFQRARDAVEGVGDKLVRVVLAVKRCTLVCRKRRRVYFCYLLGGVV